MVASAFSAGAETSTRLAPAVRCAAAFSLAVKMPVHSIAMSTPRAFQGSFEGSRSAETLILPLPRLSESPSTVTVPGKRPCTESKRNRCALVSTGPRSLMPTISMSLRPDSAIARRMLRPMRPNPLIATRTAISRLLQRLLAPQKTPDVLHGVFCCGRPVLPGGSGKYGPFVVLFPGNHNRSRPSAQALQNCVNGCLGSNAEVLEKVLARRAGAEPVHADKDAVLADHGIPAPAHGGLDCDLDRGLADDRALPFHRLRQKQLQRRHGYDSRRDAAFGKLLLGIDRDLHLGAGSKQRYLRLAACRGDQLIGTVAARIFGGRRGAQLRHVLAGQCQHRRAVDAIEREFPAFGDLDRVARAEHAHVGN